MKTYELSMADNPIKNPAANPIAAGELPFEILNGIQGI